MFNEINNKFDATLDKTMVLTEAVTELYSIDRYYMVESLSDEKFINKVKKIFKQMIEAVKKFTKELIEAVKRKLLVLNLS